jgi:hypothetical protein
MSEYNGYSPYAQPLNCQPQHALDLHSQQLEFLYAAYRLGRMTAGEVGVAMTDRGLWGSDDNAISCFFAGREYEKARLAFMSLPQPTREMLGRVFTRNLSHISPDAVNFLMDLFSVPFGGDK